MSSSFFSLCFSLLCIGLGLLSLGTFSFGGISLGNSISRVEGGLSSIGLCLGSLFLDCISLGLGFLGLSFGLGSICFSFRFLNFNFLLFRRIRNTTSGFNSSIFGGICLGSLLAHLSVCFINLSFCLFSVSLSFLKFSFLCLDNSCFSLISGRIACRLGGLSLCLINNLLGCISFTLSLLSFSFGLGSIRLCIFFTDNGFGGISLGYVLRISS